MNTRLHNILKYQSKSVDQIIKNNYQYSYLNNSKWYILIDKLTMEFEVLGVNFKLVYDNVIESNIINNVDCYPYFIEPIEYKVVEWIEFPNQFEDWINKNNRKVGKQFYYQEVDKIEAVINGIGRFMIEGFEDSVRVYGYR
jgi:hypothetical protein